MKVVKYLAFILCGIVVLAACQKEFSQETGYYGGLAKGSFEEVNGECRPIQVHGYYVTDSAFADTNYVSVFMDVMQPGAYNVSTEFRNGFAFKDSGYFINTGLQEIKLKPVGRPIAVQQTPFTISIDSSACTFTIDVVDSIIRPLVYTFVHNDTIPDKCGQDSVYGKYKVGVPLNSSNKVEVSIKVTSPGKYDITTAVNNGMYFTGSGIVFNTGTTKITLNGVSSPYPYRADSLGKYGYGFPISSGTDQCIFVVHVDTGVLPPPPINPDSAWSFKDSTGAYFHGKIDSATFTQVAGSWVLSIKGLTVTAPAGDTTFRVVVTMPGSTIAPGSYPTSAPLTSPKAFDFRKTATGAAIYTANSSTASIAVVSIIITSYNAATKVVKGTFSGRATMSTGTIPITNGLFEATVQ